MAVNSTQNRSAGCYYIIDLVTFLGTKTAYNPEAALGMLGSHVVWYSQEISKA